MSAAPLVFAATAALVAFISSLVCGGAILLSGEKLRGLAPPAQARLLLAVALAPAIAAATPAIAMFFDLAVLGCDAHNCLIHGAAWPSLPVIGLAVFFLGRLGLGVWGVTTGIYRSSLTSRALERTVLPSDLGIGVLPIELPQAFVVGMLRPRVYVSRGLLRITEKTEEQDLEAVVAHEFSHVRRRDPLRRLIATLAFAFHVPGIASALERQLARAQETAADADAARTLGDGARIALSLVRLARLQLARPPMAVGLFGDGLEQRVRELLVSRPRPDSPPAVLLLGLLAAVVVIALVAADPIHFAFEGLVGLIGN